MASATPITIHTAIAKNNFKVITFTVLDLSHFSPGTVLSCHLSLIFATMQLLSHILTSSSHTYTHFFSSFIIGDCIPKLHTPIFNIGFNSPHCNVIFQSMIISFILLAYHSTYVVCCDFWSYEIKLMQN